MSCLVGRGDETGLQTISMPLYSTARGENGRRVVGKDGRLSVATSATGSVSLAVRDLYKRFEANGAVVAAVDGVSFEVPDGSFFTLLGPSGCGKTTTLRCVAGLERPSDGLIQVAGQTVWASRPRVFVPPHRRDIGMVFQSYAIWPHLTVSENVAFPLRVERRRHSKQEIEQRVEEALETVRLGGYGRRLATQLSGGQQQRLALARALVRRPRLLLLDEPLSNLDAKLREGLRQELRSLQRQLGITTLYVTHDQVEALSMSDTIAVMSEGRIVQMGPPKTIYERPVTHFVANFVGGSNFLRGASVSEAAEGPGLFDTALGRLQTGGGDGRNRREVTIAVRPENIRVHRVATPRVNLFPGAVEEVSFLGEQLDCRIRVGDTRLTVRQHPTTGVATGDAVWVELPPEHCAVLADSPPAAA